MFFAIGRTHIELIHGADTVIVKGRLSAVPASYKAVQRIEQQVCIRLVHTEYKFDEIAPCRFSFVAGP